MENIEKRLIKTIKPGILYISPLKRMINLEMLTDQEIVKYVGNGYISKDRFDWSEYDAKKAEPAKQTEPAEPVEVVEPVEPVEVVEPVEPVEVVEPVEPVAKPKAKSTKKGKKK